jgi:hypothetical protein
MNANKIVMWIGAAIAVVGAFVAIPYAALLLLLTGLYAGFGLDKDDSVRVGVGAVVLTTLSANLDAIPMAGTFLHAILGNVGAFTAGAALMRITLNYWGRVKP